MKILISILFLFIAAFSFAENPWDYVEELVIELEASNELILELREELAELRHEVFEVRDDNAELRKENSDLRFLNAVLETQLEETTNELVASTELIIELRNELKQAQNEITFFREEYEESIVSTAVNQNTFGIGAGIVYPNGGEIIATITPPFLRTLSIYGRFGLQTSSNIIHGGAGLIINF